MGPIDLGHPSIVMHPLPVESGKLPLHIAQSGGTGAAVVIVPAPGPLDRGVHGPFRLQAAVA